MRTRRFGSTGLQVSELCLGTMTFGTNPSRFSAIAGLDQAASTALVKQALDGGINFLDTANIYTFGQSEEFTGQALRDLGIARGEVVVATKGALAMTDRPNGSGASRYHLMDQIDASLARLGLDHVDLYQVHTWDGNTPVEETLRALEDIVRSGRARYVGLSNWPAWGTMKALGIADRRGFDRIASLQAYYTVAARDIEREIAPLLKSESVGLMVWSPLAGGLLSGKYRRGEGDKAGEITGEGRRAKFDYPAVDLDRAYTLIDAMAPMAERRGGSIAQIALAWLLAQDVVSTVIVGATKPEQLADNIAASDVTLDTDELAQLDKLSALTREYCNFMTAGSSGQRP